MKLTLISLLVTALLLTFTGCMRGGNADEGDDGYLGEEETTDRILSDPIDDRITADTDRRPDTEENRLPDNGAVTDDDGILNDDGRNGFLPDNGNARRSYGNDNRMPHDGQRDDTSSLIRDSRGIF